MRNATCLRFENLIHCWVAASLCYFSAAEALAETINFTLYEVTLDSGLQITGDFDWTYTFGDFPGGTGSFNALDIPYTTFYTFALGNLIIDIQTGAIEITGDGSYHDKGLDVAMKFAQPFTATEPASLDLALSVFECCGNGFNNHDFIGGAIVPTPYLSGDFDFDGDTDAADFLKWQRDEVPNPPSDATHLANWTSHYENFSPALPNVGAVPEPGALVLFLTVTTASAFSRRSHLRVAAIT